MRVENHVELLFQWSNSSFKTNYANIYGPGLNDLDKLNCNLDSSHSSSEDMCHCWVIDKQHRVCATRTRIKQ